MVLADVFAVVALVLALGVTSWALMISCMLLFPDRVDRATASGLRGFWNNLGLGLTLLVVGVVSVVLTGQGNPLVKTVGFLSLMAILSIGAIGASGLGQIAGNRLKKMEPTMGNYPAYVRGSAFLVTASMLPVLGWFGLAPIALIFSLGCGARAVFHRTSSPPVIAGAI